MGAGWTRWWDNGRLTVGLKSGSYARQWPLVVIVERFELPVETTAPVGGAPILWFHAGNDAFDQRPTLGYTYREMVLDYWPRNTVALVSPRRVGFITNLKDPGE